MEGRECLLYTEKIERVGRICERDSAEDQL